MSCTVVDDRMQGKRVVKPRQHLDESSSVSDHSLASRVLSPHPHHLATSANIQTPHLQQNFSPYYTSSDKMLLNNWFQHSFYRNSTTATHCCLVGQSQLISLCSVWWMQSARVITNLSLRDHVKPAFKQLHWLPVEHRITYKLCLFMHHIHIGQAPQYLSDCVSTASEADTGWGRLAQRLTFCQEQVLDLKNVVSSTPVQPPGTLFHPIFMTSLTLALSENDSRMYFLILLITDYCWRSWTCRIAAPYKFYVDWSIDWLF